MSTNTATTSGTTKHSTNSKLHLDINCRKSTAEQTVSQKRHLTRSSSFTLEDHRTETRAESNVERRRRGYARNRKPTPYPTSSGSSGSSKSFKFRLSSKQNQNGESGQLSEVSEHAHS